MILSLLEIKLYMNKHKIVSYFKTRSTAAKNSILCLIWPNYIVGALDLGHLAVHSKFMWVKPTSVFILFFGSKQLEMFVDKILIL